ncbi:helix-turn-helix transcriptional regulator [Rhizobium sp. AQ_MP]|uniref:winged helix-turn-helix transcriptional regulator n=1 Tax=Rhizobium sp. AQ_MP TaxID=2761536 RepID=UPI001639C1EE|nr:helix-turn-helix domain-containing protein [Rhizobium sp. AQ_MP]MBC2774451.1 helix-turn-helix transcriptional regulator [Rhizobium sp. AQ_MP]
MARDMNAGVSDLGGCQIESTLQLLDGKWKGVILHHLLKDDVLRFNELVKRLPSITHRMLSKQLRDMEVAGLVARTVYPVVPPRVDYSLTPLGRSLEPVLQAIGRWGQEHLVAVAEASASSSERPVGAAAIMRSAA